jgi:hypothetical protein
VSSPVSPHVVCLFASFAEMLIVLGREDSILFACRKIKTKLPKHIFLMGVDGDPTRRFKRIELIAVG